MKIVCYASQARRDMRMHIALKSGFERHGATVDIVHTAELQAADLAVFIGTRRKSRKVYHAARAVGQHTLMLDKGYFVRSRYHRFSVDTPQPLYIRKVDSDLTRFASMRSALPLPGGRTIGKNIIYVEATQKYYDFHEVGNMIEYSKQVCSKLVTVAEGYKGVKIIYRPRVSSRDVIPPAPPGTLMSPSVSMGSLLADARCVVVHGSGAAIEALLAGVQVASLSNPAINPVHDLCTDDINSIMTAPRPKFESVVKRCAQLAWCQFSYSEIESGFAWDHTKQWMHQ
jgi:hypothetical protein